MPYQKRTLALSYHDKAKNYIIIDGILQMISKKKTRKYFTSHTKLSLHNMAASSCLRKMLTYLISFENVHLIILLTKL